MLKIALSVALFIPSILLASPTSRCPVTDGGTKPRLPMGFEVSEVSSSKSKDVYTIVPSQDNPYGGAKQIWTAYKDANGKIIRIESGGESPSQKLIQYELKKRGILLDAHVDMPKGDKKFAIPGFEDVKMAIAEPTDFNIKFGSSIEMKHNNSDCSVLEISERHYSPRDKKTVSEKVFSASKCDQVRNVYASSSDDLSYCSNAKSTHEIKISNILNGGVGGGGGYAPGVGGGGGAVAVTRDIASSVTTSNSSKPTGSVSTGIITPIQLSDYLHSSASGQKGSFTDLNYCDYFAPEKQDSTKPISKPGSATIQ